MLIVYWKLTYEDGTIDTIAVSGSSVDTDLWIEFAESENGM